MVVGTSISTWNVTVFFCLCVERSETQFKSVTLLTVGWENGVGNPRRSNKTSPDLASQRSQSSFVQPRRHVASKPPFTPTNPIPTRSLATLPSLQALQSSTPSRYPILNLRLLWPTPPPRSHSRPPRFPQHLRLPLVPRFLRPRWIGTSLFLCIYLCIFV